MSKNDARRLLHLYALLHSLSDDVEKVLEVITVMDLVSSRHFPKGFTNDKLDDLSLELTKTDYSLQKLLESCEVYFTKGDD